MIEVEIVEQLHEFDFAQRIVVDVRHKIEYRIAVLILIDRHYSDPPTCRDSSIIISLINPLIIAEKE